MNVGFVDDREIARLNARFRGQARATDVLSFPWEQDRGLRFEISDLKTSNRRKPDSRFQIPDSRHAQLRGDDATCQISDSRRATVRECDSKFEISDLRGFLGDIVISAETARRNARLEGHGTENEIRWLILHGVLHLCGFDHERDRGEMTTLELRLRRRLRL
ncbi:MAG TPA: rRNA maturation RNase YbeY [Terriglobia bacterium]|nr:rRNA maturation RNase YbeY [Terriglobia bacterium]